MNKEEFEEKKGKKGIEKDVNEETGYISLGKKGWRVGEGRV